MARMSKSQLRGRGQCITAGVHGRRSGMRLLPVKCDGMAFDAFRAEHNSQGKSETFQHRTLLDMKLDVSGGVFALAGRIADAVDLDPALPHRVFQPNAVFVRPAAVRLNRLGARERRRTEQTASKTRALFVRPIHQANGYRRASIKLARDAPQDRQARHDPESAVEPAAVGH